MFFFAILVLAIVGCSPAIAQQFDASLGPSVMFHLEEKGSDAQPWSSGFGIDGSVFLRGPQVDEFTFDPGLRLTRWSLPVKKENDYQLPARGGDLLLYGISLEVRLSRSLTHPNWSDTARSHVWFTVGGGFYSVAINATAVDSYHSQSTYEIAHDYSAMGYSFALGWTTTKDKAINVGLAVKMEAVATANEHKHCRYFRMDQIGTIAIQAHLNRRF
jgi:hypothetical protein